MQTVLANTVSEKQGEMIMTIAEQLRHEGELAGIEIGRLEGWQEGTYHTAANFKALGISYDIIQQATGLSLDEIERLDASSQKLDS